MSEIKEFKTESKRLLDLMIHSIYTNKEIFLRELISNASDACDKYHYLALDNDQLDKGAELKITLSVNKDLRTITIEDNGIGMTKEELENSLGTIARSGSREFLKRVEEEKQAKAEKGESADIPEIIGQFGVGFYSAYMVAKKVVVLSKSPFEEQAHSFVSSGEDTYEIDDVNKADHGTSITLFLRDNEEGEDGETYDEFLDTYTIQSLVKKYSDYVRYPIQMMIEKHVAKKDADGKELDGEYETINELETLNSMVPLWRKAKKDITDEELNTFYKSKFGDWNDPLCSIHFSVEGNVNYTALLFIPSKMPYDLYSEKYEKGLQLYTKGVFIQDKCKELLPDYLKFVRGLVDTADLPLNISRETLQANRMLKAIGSNIEKKIISKLKDLKEKEYEKYETFFKSFGATIKYGIYQEYGMNKESLQDLLIFSDLKSDKKISLSEYVQGMKEDQKAIYYVSAATKEAALAMPQMDALKKKDYNCLILSEDVDEFCLNVMKDYQGKEFKSVNQGDLNMQSDDEKKELETLTNDHKDLLSAMQEALKEEVKEVKLSSRLTDSPVCLVASDGISFSMEKIVSHVPGNEGVEAGRILELNPHHPLFETLVKIQSEKPEELKDYAELLYDESLLMEGLPVKNPVKFAELMTKIMIK